MIAYNIMIILGIDPGFDRLGIAVIEKNNVPTFGNKKEQVLHTECFSTDRKQELNERIFVIGQHIEFLLNKWKPDILAIETLFATNNQKTVMGVSEVRGVIKFLARKCEVRVCEYSPNQIKVAIAGSGSADKSQIQYMVPKLVEFDMEARLKTYKGTSSGIDDELDALAIALTASAIEKNV